MLGRLLIPAGSQQQLGDDDEAAARRTLVLQEVSDILTQIGGISKPKDALRFVRDIE